MKTSTIIFPTDFSSDSEHALEFATALAKSNRAKLLIVHIYEPPEALTGMAYQYAVPATTSEDQLRALEQIRPTDPSVEFEHRMVDGSPGSAIAEIADEVQAEMIVMSTHGRTGLKRLLMGSVAEQVLRRANCPVVSIKSHAQSEVNATS